MVAPETPSSLGVCLKISEKVEVKGCGFLAQSERSPGEWEVDVCLLQVRESVIILSGIFVERASSIA